MFIVLEVFWAPEMINPVINPETGAAQVYDTKEEAEEAAKEYCQKGLVVEIPQE